MNKIKGAERKQISFRAPVFKRRLLLIFAALLPELATALFEFAVDILLRLLHHIFLILFYEIAEFAVIRHKERAARHTYGEPENKFFHLFPSFERFPAQ